VILIDLLTLYALIGAATITEMPMTPEVVLKALGRV